MPPSDPTMWGPLSYRGEGMSHMAFFHERNKACDDFGCVERPPCGHPVWWNGLVWFHMDPTDDAVCRGYMDRHPTTDRSNR